ncbi:MAG: OmpA family protein [Casimicrobium sp.]
MFSQLFKFSRSYAVIAACAVGVLQSVATAQPVRYFAEGAVPTPIEVARAMAGANFAPKHKMRGLSVTPAESAAAIDSTPQANAAGILALAIPFEFDSAKLLPDAQPALDNVAEGIKLIATTKRPHIVIEGHTDSIGKAAYNVRLSKLRAQSVKRYFIAKHGFPNNTLVTIGKGAREPLSGMPGVANANRRVQFRLA